MSFARIRGHARALETLRRTLASGRLPHALLLSGPDGVGKRRVALELAKALNCEGELGRSEADACDACRSCRLVDRGSHPDVLVAAPEGRFLKIAQVRDAERHVTLSPFAGRRKVAILDGAEAMTQEAANAFLKTLEEPPGAAVIVLVSADPTRLLPTVRSRCQEVRFGLLAEEVVAALLVEGGMEGAEAARAAALGQGSVAQARVWAERFRVEEQDALLAGTWASLASAGRALAWARQLTDRYRDRRELVPWLLLLLGHWARDLARAASSADEGGARAAVAPRERPTDRAGVPGGNNLPLRTALAWYDAVAAAQAALEYNVNLQLALEAMLLRMRAALRGQSSR